MTYEQIVAMMQTYYANADAAMVNGHYAVQVNVIGEGEGAFYIEIAEGKVNVQPYDYVDRNAAVNAAADVLTAISEGKINYTEAKNNAQITVERDENVAAVLDTIKVVVAEKAEEKVTEPAVNAVAEKPAAAKKPAAKAKKAPARKRAVSKAAANAKSGKGKKSAK